MNIKSKNLKIRNLPKNNKRIDKINSKPYLALIIFLVSGIAIFSVSYLIGLLICALCLYNLCFIRNMILTEFFDDYAVFYNTQKKDECFILFWQDIAKWKFQKQRSDLDILEVHLKDGRKVTFQCVSKRKTLNHFHKYSKATEIITNKRSSM